MEKFKRLEEETSGNIQEIENIIEKNAYERAYIGFPHGVIRRANDFREQLLFISDYTFQSNLAYHLMLTDFYKWILNRFYIRLTLKEMLIKEGVCLFGNICGAIAQYIGKELIDTNQTPGVKTSLTAMVENDIIDEHLKKDVLKLWGDRNKEHIFTLSDREYGKYTHDNYNEAVFTWNRFKESIQESGIKI